MNVLQLFTTTNPQMVVDAHNTAFPHHVISRATYDEFLALIRRKVPVTNSDIVEIAHWRVEHDDPTDDEDRFDVLLVSGGTEYSMSFQDWGKLLACEVKCDIPTYFPPVVQAAYVFWEMTWHGFEEDMIERRDELSDRVDDLHRAIEERDAAGDPDAPLRGTTRSTNIWDDLFPDDTPEQRAAREAETARHIANYHTRRVFKNGVLQPNDPVESKTDD